MERSKPRVLISSDPRDGAWRDRLIVQLDVHALQGLLDPWDERRINGGEARDAALRGAMDAASVAILIVTANFLASEFLQTDVVPHLLRRRAHFGLTIIPILATPCDWQSVAWLRGLELRPRQRRCLSEGTEHQITADLADIAREVRLLISGAHEHASAPAYARKRTPMYPDDETRTISHKLQIARIRKAELASVGASTAEVEREILDLRRQLRRGGQLKAGDSLGDGRYLLLNRVGRGGFAVVWEALDRNTATHVAVKVLHSDLAGDAIRRERLFRGAREMAALQHAAVVRVLEPHGEDDGYQYYVMELVTNGDLRRAVIERRVRFDDIFPIVFKVGDALAEAHARGMVHRDVKPANILIDASGEPKLTDFDLVNGAHTTGGTRTGALGTFLYAAPELLEHPQDADARADVYGLAMTAIFCLYGGDLPHLVWRDANQVIRGLPVSDGVKSVLQRATDWTKENRHSDARAFCEALHRCMSVRQLNSGAPLSQATSQEIGWRASPSVTIVDPPPHVQKGNSRRWLWYIGAMPVLAVLVAASIAVIHSMTDVFDAFQSDATSHDLLPAQSAGAPPAAPSPQGSGEGEALKLDADAPETTRQGAPGPPTSARPATTFIIDIPHRRTRNPREE
ncbi:serine/threonine-protein kinase [Sorangium sp. So ce385]|uniref:serine/threonine-protein kinase n=1 Tax=Sorangium sp. So ce385 TaxID=3133308 RepID=UPI003F5B651C